MDSSSFSWRLDILKLRLVWVYYFVFPLSKIIDQDPPMRIKIRKFNKYFLENQYVFINFVPRLKYLKISLLLSTRHLVSYVRNVGLKQNGG